VGRRFEVASIGVDEALQGFSADPFDAFTPSATGLRVPSLIPANGGRYLFLLATRQVNAKDRVHLRGWRQLVKIGISSPGGGAPPPSRPVELAVTTPDFRFPDGNVSWHLVREPMYTVDQTRKNTDLPNFMYQTADQAALLYQSYTQSAPTGYYMLNLTSYVPPTGMQGSWEPIGGLGNVHEIRAPWTNTDGWNTLDERVTGPCRISLYASVLQTNPLNAARAVTFPVGSLTSEGIPPEESFIANMAGIETGVVYWRVAGALMFEDEDKMVEAVECP